jgi:hypothetical protein
MGTHKPHHCRGRCGSNVHVLELLLHAFWPVERCLGVHFVLRLPCAFRFSFALSSGFFFGIRYAPHCLLQPINRCIEQQFRHLADNMEKELTYIA